MSVQVLFIINKYCIYLYSTSTDRYANVDVGVLLYHIERYPGIIILTTNLIDNIDKAFFRRLRYILQLDIPPRELRAKIWKVSCTGCGHRCFINKASVLNSEICTYSQWAWAVSVLYSGTYCYVTLSHMTWSHDLITWHIATVDHPRWNSSSWWCGLWQASPVRDTWGEHERGRVQGSCQSSTAQWRCVHYYNYYDVIIVMTRVGEIVKFEAFLWEPITWVWSVQFQN